MTQTFEDAVKAFDQAQAASAAARAIVALLNDKLADLYRYGGNPDLLPGMKEAERLARREAERLSSEASLAFRMIAVRR